MFYSNKSVRQILSAHQWHAVSNDLYCLCN